MQNLRYYIPRAMIPVCPGEVVLETYQGVNLVLHDTCLENLTMQLTSHRILFVSNDPKHALIVDMSVLTSVDGKESGMFKKEVHIQLSTVFNDKIKLYLSKINDALLQIRGTLNKGSWKQVTQPKKQEEPGFFAGIYDQQRKYNSDLSQKQTQMQQSFDSFETLFVSIKQLKEVTNYVKDNLKLYDESMQQKTEIQSILNDIGFVSSITKEEAGKNYYKEEAKRIFEICNSTLFGKFGGMIPLLDLFYFYNKKRQTLLIAPEQILKACSQMERMGLGARVVTYKGNIKMLESTSFDVNADFENNFSQFFSYQQGVSIDQISKRKGLPLVVVQIKLDNALKRGRIVKDDRIQGVRYFNNLILAMK